MPSRYQVVTQHHHRSIVKVFLAIKHIFGSRLQGWVSEQRLKEDEEWQQKKELGREKRILDGQALLLIRKTLYRVGQDGEKEPTGEIVEEPWRCGVEIELTPKTVPRYEKQLKALAAAVYDSFNKKQLCPM